MQQHTTVRPSAIAGSWYPGTAAELRRTVAGLIEQAAVPTLPAAPLALITPHAGYNYSGPTAARAYATVLGASFRRAILMGPLHRPLPGDIAPFMIAGEDAYSTPLGEVAVDHEFLHRIAKQVPALTMHGDQEHSLEIQLPFLQVALAPDFEIAPILFGEYVGDPAALRHVEQLAETLASAIHEVEGASLLVASTDLSHLHNHRDVVTQDELLVQAVRAYDVDGLRNLLFNRQAQACGALPLLAAVQTARLLGATAIAVLGYATSGDVTGDRRPGTYTVGYLAAAIHR